MKAKAKRQPRLDEMTFLGESMLNANRSERQGEDHRPSVLCVKDVSRKMHGYDDVCRLTKAAFPRNELMPLWLLNILALRKSVNFRAFYEDERFCGIMYTAENDKYVYVLYLAVNDRIRSKGYGSKMLDWLKRNTDKAIVLDVESIDPSAENARQRERRISFYSRNGIFDTGCKFTDEGETYSVLTSDVEGFDAKEIESLLSSFSFGTYRIRIA